MTVSTIFAFGVTVMVAMAGAYSWRNRADDARVNGLSERRLVDAACIRALPVVAGHEGIARHVRASLLKSVTLVSLPDAMLPR